ncbi:phage tail tape measure protein [Mycobacteroides abscessus]|uniref:phage tail tape measure protein n=1 Tax=Mycobacteroides abscessus TaxID=36809 RepID=UPI0005E7E7CA|nr:phage tail tape measure protein [Mycobacteroides abscessus]CPR79182.1 Putative phage tail tape measure protein TMP [Mycobacteroides abscessus]CPR88337.1 Putative phage tail tape measure protein TMP [Mycobacteroides abscessus]CPS43281.1 Putative phage tail tape measure protein TMP [Mycobacteroides abscessus]CPV03077.1 Putative phage tail tape measure protein TMP [Mycobacteroides abscessus]
MADRTNIGYAMLPVALSFENITKEIAGKLGIPLKAAGTKAGVDAGAAIAAGVEQAKGKVEASSAKVATALKKIEDQTGKLRVAEAQLQSLRDRGITDAGRLAAAEEKVAASQRNLTQAEVAHANASGSLRNAQTNLAKAEREAGDAAEGAALKFGLLSRVSGATGNALGVAASGARSLTGSLAGAAGLVGGVAAVTTTLTKALTVGLDYTRSMNTMQAVSGATAEQMAAVGDRARELGNDISLPGTSANDAASAMTELAKGGFDVQQSMDAAKGTLQLAAAAGISAAEAATIQSNALNAFGLSADYAGKMSDILANAANASSAEITDIAFGLQAGSAVANQFGISARDTAATLALLANNGIKSSDAGTLLKTALLHLAAPSDQASQALDALGINAYDAQGNFVGLSAIMGELQEASKRLTPQMFQENAAIAFGSDAARLAGVGAKEGAAGFDKMAQAMDRSGAAADVAAARTKGLPGAVERIGNAVESFSLALYDVIKGPAEEWADKLAEGIGKAEDGFKAAVPYVKDFFKEVEQSGAIDLVKGAFTGLIDAVTDVVSAGIAVGRFFNENKELAGGLAVILTTMLAPALAAMAVSAASAAAAMVVSGATTAGYYALVAATKAWTIAQWLLNAAMSANPISLIVIGIAALAAGLIYAYKHSETFRRIVDAAWKGIKEAASATVEWFTNTAWPFLQRVWEGIKAGWTGLVDAAQEVWTGIRDKFNAVVDFFANLPTAIKEKAIGMWDSIKDSFKSMVNALIMTWNGMAEKLTFTMPDIPGVPRRGETLQPIPSIPLLATGGVVRGPGTGTSDSILARLSNGEGVVREAAMRGNGGVVVTALNAGWVPSNDYLRAMLTGIPAYAEGLNPGADFLRNTIMQMWPKITRIGGRRSEDGFGEHSTGNAIDVMIPDYNSPEGMALGNTVLAFLQKNASALDVNGIIWRQTSYGYGGSFETGTGMPDRGTPTQNHMDHLHVILGKGRGAGASATAVPTAALSGVAGAAAPLSAGGVGGGGIPAGATAGVGPNGEAGYYQTDPRKLRDAEQKVADADDRVKRAEQRVAELGKKAKESERMAAQDSLEKAQREAKDARDDLEETKKGKFTKTKEARGGAGGGQDGGSGSSINSVGGIFGSFLKETFGLDGSWLPDIANFGPLKMFDSFMTAFKGPIQGAIDGQLGIQQPGWTPGSDWRPAQSAPVSAGGTSAPGVGDAPGTEGGLNIAGLNIPGFQAPPVDASINVTANGPGADEIATAVRRAAPDQQTRLPAAIPTGF